MELKQEWVLKYLYGYLDSCIRIVMHKQTPYRLSGKAFVILKLFLRNVFQMFKFHQFVEHIINDFLFVIAEVVEAVNSIHVFFSFFNDGFAKLRKVL